MVKRKSKQKVRILLGAFLLIVFSALLINLSEQPEPGETAAPQVALPEAIEPNPYLLSLLKDYEKNILQQQKKTRTPGVAIAVVQDSTIVYLKGFGLREIGKPDSINPHTVFRLASVSKCFAPVLTGLLVEEGVL